MTTNRFSDVTKEALAKAGWTPDRQVDISAYERRSRETGGDDGKAACDFLRRYGDLEVEILDLGESCVNTKLAPLLQMQAISEPVDQIEKTLFHIGRCNFEFEYLLMDSTGAVYRHMEMTSQNFGGIDLIKFADSGEQAIEKLVHEGFFDTPVGGITVAHWD